MIDDGSPDRCGEICDEYKEKDQRVRVFRTENRGLSAARNLGLKEAKGEYIGFVDADDWVEPDMYEVLLRRIEETGADIATCGLWIDFVSSSAMARIPEAVYERTESLRALLDQKISNHVWNKLYRKFLFASTSFPEGSNYEDIIAMHRLVNDAVVVATASDPKYHYRQRNDSITKKHLTKDLIAYADAYMDRFNFLKAEQPSVFSEKKGEIICATAVGISRLWRWWYKCPSDEKQVFANRITELVDFSRDYYPLFGYPSWPTYLRLSSPFMHTKSDISFTVLYWLNHMFRCVRKHEYFK